MALPNWFIKNCLIAALLVTVASPMLARHIVGGDVTYRCLDDLGASVQYEVTLIMYRDGSDANAAEFDPSIQFGIFRERANSFELVGVEQVSLRSNERIIPQSPSPCLSIPSFDIFRGEYRFTITLRKIPDNYHFVYQRCCRNNTINNIERPGEQGAAFMAILTPAGQQVCSSSPTFDQFPPIVICEGIELTFDHGATDPDGDQTTYQFCSPLTAGGQGGTRAGDGPGAAERCDGVTPAPENCPPPFQPVQFITPQFTAARPLAGNPAVEINPIDGTINGVPELLGQFVVGVCVQEFRNGVLMGEIRRDFQFNVTECPVNVEIALDAPLLAPKSYYIRSCGDENVFINNQSQDINLISQYDWLFPTTAGDLQSADRSPTIGFPGVGQYVGTLILNKQDSICADTAQITVDVFPEVTADYVVDYDTCAVGPVAFTDVSNTGAAGGLVSWEWDFGDGDTSTEPSPIHSFEEPASYQPILAVTDVNNCTDTVAVEFLWAPIPPLVVVQPSAFIGCAPATVTFNNLSEPINELYDIEWTFSDGQTSTDISPSVVFEEPGTFGASVLITSPFGCTLARNYPDWIETRPSPTALFTFDPTEPSIFNPDVQFTDESIDAINWTWRFDDEGFSNMQNPSYTFRDTGIYEVELVVQHISNCTDTLIRLIDISPEVTLFFPNAFTPNNDGLHETFKGVGFTAGITDYEMTIWNRWGEEIFNTNDLSEGWPGTDKRSNKLVPEGVYVYMVTYTGPRGEKAEERGSVSVIR
jgi:gliding motility-associated-like protein